MTGPKVAGGNNKVITLGLTVPNGLGNYYLEPLIRRALTRHFAGENKDMEVWDIDVRFVTIQKDRE